MVERLLPIPEVRGLNSVIGNIPIEHLLTVNCIEKTKINKKRRPMAKKNNFLSTVKILYFSGIQTWIIGIEGSHADQCDQIGQILNVIGDKVSSKSSPKFIVTFGTILKKNIF